MLYSIISEKIAFERTHPHPFFLQENENSMKNALLRLLFTY